VEYRAAHGGFDSVSLYLNIDGVLHKLIGSRGTWSLDFAGDQIPLIKFSFVGLWTKPVAVALPAVSYAAFVDPEEATETNTTTVRLHGYDAILVSANLALNANPRIPPRVNKRWVAITDHPVSGEMVIEEPDLAVKDYYAAAEDHVLGAMQIVHGTQPGNIVEVGGPGAQVVRLGKGQADDIVTLTLGLSLTNEVGGYDVSIIFK
ncbi:MAG TPA: hypothetical protein VLL76_00355, partial [Candidatus Omnitrophota bacterium]|nr:hypothetical protein [Candidatus Omnitrophota bacterium]